MSPPVLWLSSYHEDPLGLAVAQADGGAVGADQQHGIQAAVELPVQVGDGGAVGVAADTGHERRPGHGLEAQGTAGRREGEGQCHPGGDRSSARSLPVLSRCAHLSTRLAAISAQRPVQQMEWTTRPGDTLRARKGPSVAVG